jgi:2-polyprenyl-3-methyl-5-hydroxy-6-metoxy-1,4-benzoquinol methylase
MSTEISRIEKSNVMENHYKESADPWGNTERQIYQRIMKQTVINALKYIDKPEVNYYDIGAGGGNIIDTVLKNKEDKVINVSGCDISESAINWLSNKYHDGKFEVINCDKYLDSNRSKLMNSADLITIIDVMYYFGGNGERYYKLTLDELWKTFKSGAIIVVADSIIPYQRRTYFKIKDDCETLMEYTEYCEPVGINRDTGHKKFLKVKIYRKL